MLKFSFSYKYYNISLTSSVDGIPYVVRCVSDDDKTVFIKDCYTRPEAFRFVYKLLAFIDDLE